MFYILSGCGGGLGAGGGGGGGLGLLGSGPHQLLFYLDSFLTFLLFGGLCSLQAPVYKFLSEGRPLWSPFFNPF